MICERSTLFFSSSLADVALRLGPYIFFPSQHVVGVEPDGPVWTGLEFSKLGSEQSRRLRLDTHTHTSHPKNETTMQSPRRFRCFGILLKYHHGNWKPTINGGFCIAGRIIYEWDIFQPPIFDCCRVEGLFIASTI